MKIFLDTANLDELEKGARMGVVDGVTTNPTLIAKERRPLAEHIRMFCDVVDGDISAEVVSTDAPGMIREGRELSRIHQLSNHPLTDKRLDQFLKDWTMVFQETPVAG